MEDGFQWNRKEIEKGSWFRPFHWTCFRLWIDTKKFEKGFGLVFLWEMTQLFYNWRDWKNAGSNGIFNWGFSEIIRFVELIVIMFRDCARVLIEGNWSIIFRDLSLGAKLNIAAGTENSFKPKSDCDHYWEEKIYQIRLLKYPNNLCFSALERGISLNQPLHKRLLLFPLLFMTLFSIAMTAHFRR